MTNFGATFKKARESNGVSLDQIAKQTRISTRFLAAIENEEFHVLPGGIFNKGFVRAFAESVGLDPDQAVADYERLVSVREPSEDAPLTPPPPLSSERYLYPIAVGVLALAIVIFYIVTRESRTVEFPSSAPESATPAPPQAFPETEPLPPAATSPVVAEPEPMPTRPFDSQTLTLDIGVRETTWIKVRSDGNEIIPGEILKPGMKRTFTAMNRLYLSIGNAAGLELKVNDIPLKPLGKSGQVRSITITQSNLKDFIE